MGLRHLAHEVQTQARALLAGVGAGQGVEALEEAAEGVVGDARAFVCDGQDHLVNVCGDAHVYRAAGGTEFDRVLDEVLQRLMEEEGVAGESQAVRDVEVDPDGGLGEAM